eukprot:TRINITY_DN16052_c0_g1_i2.p1 TRINITY_DN16052_c0_g1~~TRINITY_DN16052_c0_g1_i2.p1  ORF type:complete len:1450 (+),score=618.42 TRINITY_DN16052_c0_g1_i2:74-4351(+)
MPVTPAVPEHAKLLVRVWAEDPQIADICEANGLTRDGFVRRRHQVEKLELFLTALQSLRSFEWFTNLVTLRVMHQDVTRIEGLDGLHSLEGLWLCENRIARIEGLGRCKRLRELYLTGNRLQCIEGLAGLEALETLWLAENHISEIEGLDQLRQLRVLSLASNRISQVGHRLDHLVSLEELNLAHNRIGSFRDVARLRNLPGLRKLCLRDPHYGDNPVCSLCNYQTYVLYHLSHLSMIDMTEVADDARHLAEATFLKKQMYYSMRTKTLLRNASNLVRAAGQMRQAKCAEVNLSLNVLLRLSRELEREISEARHLPPSPSAPPLPAGIDDKLRAVQAGVRRRQEALQQLGRDFAALQLQIDRAAKRSAARLMLELGTGGNVRIEEGRSGDVWYQSCVDLVRSRFFQSDFEPLGIRDVRVTSVTRIHSRHLRNRFEERLAMQPDPGGTGQKRSLEYLFVGEDPDDHAAIHNAAEEGFPAPAELERAGRDGGVPLSNSVFLTDQARLLDAHKRGLLAARGGAAPPEAAAAWSAQVLVCKTYLGRPHRERNPGGRTRAQPPADPDDPAACCMERLVMRPGAPAGSKIKRSDYPPDAGCCFRQRRGDTKQCVWFAFDPALVLPEYVVELQYVPFPSVFSPMPALLNTAGLPTGDALLFDLQRAMRRATPPAEVDTAGMRTLAQYFLAFQRSCSAVDDGDGELLADACSFAPGARQRPKLSAADDGTLKRLCRVEELSRISYLNLFGNQLRSLPRLRDCTGLQILVLSFNEIEKIEGLQSLPNLHTADLSFNVIKRIEGMEGLPALTTLELNNNLVYRMDDVAVLKKAAPGLLRLVLQNNAVCEVKSYRRGVLCQLPQLRELDGEPVQPGEAAEARSSLGALTPEAVLRHAKVQTPALLPCSAPTAGGDAEQGPARGELQLSDVTDVSLEHMALRSIQGLEQCTNLRRLSMLDNEVTRIEGLRHCARLEELGLENNSLVKIEGLSHLRCLRRLELGKNKISRIDGLANLPNLCQLSLEDNDIASLKGLEHCAALMELYIANNRIAEVSEVNHLRPVSKLIILDLSGNPLCSGADYRMFTVFSLKKLKVLDGLAVDTSEAGKAKDAFVGRLTGELLSERAGATNWSAVDTLNLSGCSLKELGMLEHAEALTSLNLDRNALTGLEGLKGLGRLARLSARENRIAASADPRHAADRGAIGRSLAALTLLEVLCLEGNQISSIAALGLRLPVLHTLRLRGNDLQRLDGLEHLPQLRELDVGRNKLRELGDRALACCAGLRVLNAESNLVRTLDGLRHLTRLERLNIAQNRVSDLHELWHLAPCTRLVEVTATGNPVARKSVYRLSLLQRLPSAETVDGQLVTAVERERIALHNAVSGDGRPGTAPGSRAVAGPLASVLPRPSWQGPGGGESAGPRPTRPSSARRGLDPRRNSSW